ncbi:hypothetical protein N7540_001692 [Penicillium herquei]|nr:hypothetical protein N7540_001692 [Penicillium herquei]
MKTGPPPFHPRNATEEEIQALPHTFDHIPRAIWIVLVAAAAERFSFYAFTNPWLTEIFQEL